MLEKIHERFERIVNTIEIGPVAILISQVDPDAVGSAFGLKFILEQKFGKECKIYYSGTIDHPQNKAICNKYNLLSQMKLISQEGLAGKFTALVDSSLTNDGRFGLNKPIEPNIVIDHHRDGTVEESDDKFIWIEDVGASCTLVCELMQHFLEPIDIPQMIATLLTLGIHTDTKGLLGASDRDREAFNNMADLVSYEEISAIINYTIPTTHFKYLESALHDRVISDGRLVTGVGFMQPNDGDHLAVIADYLVRMEGVSLVLVWGIIGNKVRVSARSDNLSINLSDFLRQKIGPISGAKITPDGRGEGGGQLDLNLGIWRTLDNDDEVLLLVRNWFRGNVLID
jgi:nanoRNase/pAp phosphatase (c-di-AMP/oligoRNAs hydrolase)